MLRPVPKFHAISLAAVPLGSAGVAICVAYPCDFWRLSERRAPGSAFATRPVESTRRQMTDITLSFAALTDVGLMRETNEDACLITDLSTGAHFGSNPATTRLTLGG